MARDERGESLLELIIAVAIMGIAVLAVVGGLGTAVVISDYHRKQANAGEAVRDYGEAIENQVLAGGYIPCATASSYAGFTAPAGYSGSVVSGSLRYWTGSAWSSTCGTDLGLQQLTVQVASTDGRAAERLVIVVRRPCGLGEAPCPAA